MSKIDTKVAELHLQEIAEYNAEMRAKATPEVREVMDEVQRAIDGENAAMDAQFVGESKLRTWANQLCGVALDISEIEDLNLAIKRLRAGQVYTFTPARSRSIKEGRVPVTIYKTVLGSIDRLDNYIYILEKTIVDLSNKNNAGSLKEDPKELYTELSFFGLIKLAFKRLLNRRK